MAFVNYLFWWQQENSQCKLFSIQSRNNLAVYNIKVWQQQQRGHFLMTLILYYKALTYLWQILSVIIVSCESRHYLRAQAGDDRNSIIGNIGIILVSHDISQSESWTGAGDQWEAGDHLGAPRISSDVSGAIMSPGSCHLSSETQNNVTTSPRIVTCIDL